MTNFFKTKLHHIILIIAFALFVYFDVYAGYIFKVALSPNSSVNGIPTQQVTAISEPLKKIAPLTDPVTVLLLCGDQSSGNTDTIMVFNYDPQTCDIRLISIPRDTAIYLNGRIYKINAAYPFYGMDYAAKTMSNVLGCSIDYHAYIDTSLFRKVIDILGGVEIDVPVDMDYDDKSQNLHIHLKKGRQVLNGQQAEGFCRFRKPNNYSDYDFTYYNGSDINRIEAQQYFITQLIDQKANVKYISMASSILEQVFSTVKTNMSKDTALRLLHNIGNNLSAKSLKQYRLSGTTGAPRGASGSFFLYNGEIYDNTNQKQISRSTFIKKYFNTSGKYVKLNEIESLNTISSMKSMSSSSYVIPGGGYSDLSQEIIKDKNKDKNKDNE